MKKFGDFDVNEIILKDKKSPLIITAAEHVDRKFVIRLFVHDVTDLTNKQLLGSAIINDSDTSNDRCVVNAEKLLPGRTYMLFWSADPNTEADGFTLFFLNKDVLTSKMNFEKEFVKKNSADWIFFEVK